MTERLALSVDLEGRREGGSSTTQTDMQFKEDSV